MFHKQYDGVEQNNTEKYEKIFKKSQEQKVEMESRESTKCDYILGKTLASITMTLFPLSNYLITRYSINKWFSEEDPIYYVVRGLPYAWLGTILILTFQLSFFLAFSNYIMASFSNPGFIDPTLKAPPEEILPENLYKFCFKCKDKCWKPPRAHHCRVCNRCVFRMDHHCDWIDNCVGVRNQKYFISFLSYTTLYCIYTFALMLVSFILWLSFRNFPFFTSDDLTLTKIGCFLIGFLSLFFIFFCCDFLYEQIEGVSENQTTVESHKNVWGKPGSFFVNLKQVFGPFGVGWFLPLKPNPISNYLEIVYSIKEIENINTKYLEDELKNLDIFNDYAIKN